jgi:hypothetical protein
MSTIAVTNLKHESASGNNITLDSSGYATVNTGLVLPNNTFLRAKDTSGNAIRFAGVGSDNKAYVGAFDAISGGGACSIMAGGNEVIKSDSSGRVTMPYQPAFAAKKNTNQNLSGGTTADITFGAAIVNIGSHYNTSTSKFTAPIAGTYFFSFQISAAFNSASYISLVPLKNGSGLGNYAAFSGSTTNGGYTVLSTSFIITLAANDYINCQLEHNNNPTLDNAGMFCGYLIG